MDTRAAEKTLMDLENRFWRTMQDRDVKTAAQMTDYPCIVAGPQGVASIDEKAFASMMGGGAWTLKDFSLGEPQVRMISDDVAIVAYKVKESLSVEGEPVTLEAADASVWVRRDGRWLCAMHTESLSGDPYGRDRQKTH
jgi:hypothetical protein